MPPVVVAGAALVSLRWDYGGVAAVNVLGAIVQPTTTINQALANTLDAAIKGLVTTHIGSSLHPTTRLMSVGIRDIRTANLAEFIGAGAPLVGTGSGDMLPRSNAVVITLRTASSGQSFRGRSYIGGWSEGANDTGGAIAAAINGACVNFVTAIGSSFTSNGLQLAVVSRPAERKTIVTTTFHADGTQDVDTKTLNARSGRTTAVTAVVGRNSIWDTQRRRAGAGSGSSLFQPIAGADLATGATFGTAQNGANATQGTSKGR